MTVDQFKRFKMINIITYGLIAAVTAILGVISIVTHNFIFAYILAFTPIFLVLFIFSFCLNYQEYKIEGNTVLCYAGWEKHYLILNGEIVDEHITGFSFTALELKYKDDFHEYNMTVSLSNYITLKVDGKLVRPKK